MGPGSRKLLRFLSLGLLRVTSRCQVPTGYRGDVVICLFFYKQPFPHQRKENPDRLLPACLMVNIPNSKPVPALCREMLPKGIFLFLVVQGHIVPNSCDLKVCR